MPAKVRSVHLIWLDCKAILSRVEPQGTLGNGVEVRIGSAWDYMLPVAEQTQALYERCPRSAPWISYLMVDAESGQVVGVCSFVDAPADGTVEIAYYTFPPYEGAGYATAAALALAALAESSPLVETVMARTLMEPNASTRVLTKCGFALMGEVTVPEDGAVWQWERPVNQQAGNAPTDFVHV